jgi:hypothetical protein
MQRPLFLLLLEIKFTTIINEGCNRTPNCDTSVTETGLHVANFIGKQFVLNFRRVRFLAERIVYKLRVLKYREFLVELQCLVNSPVILF